MQTVGILACMFLMGVGCWLRGYTVGFEKGQSEGIKDMTMVQFAADSDMARQMMVKVEQYRILMESLKEEA